MSLVVSKQDWFEGAPLGQLVYDRTYSRTMDEETNTKECWPDTVRRVVQGNISFVDPKFIEPGEAEALEDLLLKRVLIPAGRHLWVTGVEGRAFTQNCHVAGFETGLADHVAFVFDELMKGGGVGANYSSHYLKGLTPLAHKVDVAFICDPSHADYESLRPLLTDPREIPENWTQFLRIEDSREGWVDSLYKLITTSQTVRNGVLVFDVTPIRCAGSPIRGFGGTASGPLALMLLLNNVATLSGRGEITPELTMLIDHYIAEAVIAGNVRRSARMSILHWKDPFIFWFLSCKLDPLHHWSTNISVEIDDEFLHDLKWGDGTTNAEVIYERVIKGMLDNGEPGFYNSSLASVGEMTHLGATNPCGEMPLESWESCNLGHVNLAFGGNGDHLTAFRLMTRFLLRATHCDISDPKQQEVVDRNRRIGVGFFGLQEWLAGRSIKMSQFNSNNTLRDHLMAWAYIVRKEADGYADEMGIPRPIKTTTLAPTGSIAKLAGTSESMQAIFAKYYIRRVRYSTNDHEVEQLRERGVPLQPCVYSANTLVASFPCRDTMLDRVSECYVEEQNELSVESTLGLQALIQKYYADNAISCTINLPDADLDTRLNLQKNLKKFLPEIKGTTVFVDASRPQSPLEKITEEEYYRLSALIQPATINSGTSEQLLEECQGGACPIR